MTFAEASRAFWQWLTLEKGLAPTTVDAYLRDIESFVDFLRTRKVEDLQFVQKTDVAAYLDKLRAEGKRASSRARAFVSLREFFGHLKSSGLTNSNPVESFEAPKKSLVLPRVLDSDEVAALIGSVKGDSPRDLRDRAILELMYGCGFRVSEICSLELIDCHLDENVIRCFGKGSKERFVPILGSALEALGRYLSSARIVFEKGVARRELFLTRRGGPFTRMGIFKMLRERGIAAGLDPERLSPHVLRHCFATHLLANGADVRSIQEMLGHASVTTTQIYTHVDQKRIAAIHEECHPRP